MPASDWPLRAPMANTDATARKPAVQVGVAFANARNRRPMVRACWRARSVCSQSRSTRQPRARSSRVMRRSRARLPAIFASQNARRERGRVACSGQPCQKQPSTNTASRARGNAKSGRPGSGRCRRQPVIPCSRSKPARRTSVVRLPRERTSAMRALLSTGVRKSTLGNVFVAAV